MRSRAALPSLLLVVALAATPAAAALEWVSHSFTGTTAPLQTTLDVAFAFRNTGDKPVTIRSVQTNCDCLAAATDKTTYQPGEAGLITARFTVGDRYGLYQRAVTVVTDDGPPQKLSVAIEVAEPALVTPRQLEWSLGAASSEQTVDVRVADGVRIDFTETFATNDAFAVRFETVEPARLYRMHIAPKRTDVVANAALRLKGTAANGAEIVVSAYANVR